MNIKNMIIEMLGGTPEYKVDAWRKLSVSKARYIDRLQEDRDLLKELLVRAQNNSKIDAMETLLSMIEKQHKYIIELETYRDLLKEEIEQLAMNSIPLK